MVQRYNILGRYTNQYLCLCSRAWSVEVSHGKIRVRRFLCEIKKVVGSMRENTNTDDTDLTSLLEDFIFRFTKITQRYTKNP